MQAIMSWIAVADREFPVGFVIDAMLKSTVLLVLAVTITGMMRRRWSAAVRHRVWCLTLAGLLLLPMLSCALPEFRIAILPPSQASDLSSTADATRPSVMATRLLDHRDDIAAQRESPGRARKRVPDRSADQGSLDATSITFTRADGAVATEKASQSPETLVIAAGANPQSNLLRFTATVIGTLWLLGCFVVLLPLAISSLHSLWLELHARHVTDASWIDLLDELRRRLQIERRVKLIELGRPVIPMTWGLWRPVVIVPQSARQWPERLRRFVLLHELAHVKRWDVPFQLLGRFACAVYWFHPLAWYALWRLRVERELACDDCVVTTGERPSDYAEQLLQVARTCRGMRLTSVGVAMARVGHLEGRIVAMFDKARSHVPLSARGAHVLLIATMFLITAVAVVHPEARETGASAAGDDANKATTHDAEATRDVKRIRSYSGKVHDSMDQPLVDAAIWLDLSLGAEDENKIIRQVATSNADGRFAFTLDRELADAIDAAKGQWSANLIATMPNRGLGWFPLQMFADDPEEAQRWSETIAEVLVTYGEQRITARSLVLPAADVPIRGRIIDLEGAPRKNVTVAVEFVHQPDVRLLLRSFEEKSKDRYFEALRAAAPAWGLRRESLRELRPSVTTDANGWFEMSGLGDDQLASLTLTGAGVESQVIYVLGRALEPVRLPHLDMYPQGTQDVFYGRDFSHAVGPSVPLTGIVKEFDSGAPIANTLVYVERLFSEGGGSDEGQLRLDASHIRTRTDAQGRFQLDGLPSGKGHVLVAMPPKSEPLLAVEQRVNLSAADSAVSHVEIQVKRVMWIDGRITDKTTGKGVNAYVDYLPLRTNPHTLEKLGLRESFQLHHYHTDKDGHYRVPGLAGPGVIHVRAIDDSGYPLAVGAETIDGYERTADYLPTTHIFPLSNWNLVRQIDPATDARSFTCNLELDAGWKVIGRVVRPDGTEVSKFSALGEIEHAPFWKPIVDGTFTVESYDGVGPRHLFFKTTDESLVGSLRIEGQAPESCVVRLEPAVRVVGRLIAHETDLPADRYLLGCESSSQGPFYIGDCKTDDNGRFEINGLKAGLTYEIVTANSKRFSSGKNNFAIDLSQATPGDTVDLGDVRGKQADKKP